MPDKVNQSEDRVGSDPGKDYAPTGKVMLTTIAVFFAIVVFLTGLHLYSRIYVARRRCRHLERPRLPADDRGLDPAVVKSLPVFLHAPAAAPVECSVCITEFEDKEVGRVLPGCGHAFHTGCIDMWFRSHSTCPLCRFPVEPPVETEPGSSSVKSMLSNAAATETGEVDLESGPSESDRVRVPS